MKNSPHHLKHLKEKAIKEAQKEDYTEETPEQMIQNPHWKEQFNAPKDQKPVHPHHKKIPSKRTSPGEVHVETEPAHMEHENEYIMNKVQSKNLDSAARLNKKMSKMPPIKNKKG